MVDQTPRQRGIEKPWRSWYWSKQWRGTAKADYADGLRFKIMLRDLYTCRMCGRIEGNPSKLVVDHIKPHQGNPDLFWDEDNLQTLCKPCHDGEKQKQERQDNAAPGVWY